ncbi:MAG: AzlD domain-containing protein [Geminicoccaceae bacterium]
MLEVAVILLLAVATYATRIGGYRLAQRLQPSPFVEAFMTAMPGTIFAALVAPMVLAAGPAGWVSAGVGFVAMRRLGNFFLALALAMAAYLTLVLTMGA